MPHKDPEARREYQRRWCEQNRERKREQGRAWTAKNRERVRAAAKENYAANREERRAKRRAYYAEHREAVCANTMKWRKSPHGHARKTASERRWRKENADRLLIVRVRYRMAKGLGVKPEKIPHELIMAKVAQVKAREAIRERQKK